MSRARTQIQVVILLLPGISAAANFIAVITGITVIAIIRALRVGPGQSLVRAKECDMHWVQMESHDLPPSAACMLR